MAIFPRTKAHQLNAPAAIHKMAEPERLSPEEFWASINFAITVKEDDEDFVRLIEKAPLEALTNPLPRPNEYLYLSDIMDQMGLHRAILTITARNGFVREEVYLTAFRAIEAAVIPGLSWRRAS